MDVDALVVGAGVAGLAAARELEARGVEVALVEADDGPGGVMRSDTIRGHVLERGPNSLLLRAPFLAGLERFDVSRALVKATPASRSRWLLRDGRLVPVPLGPLDLVRTPLLSGAGKRRLLREPFVPRGDGSGETVAEFVSRRLGGELVDALVGPFLTGVYAGDERELGAEAVFPSLVDAERESGSIVRGLIANARRARRARRSGQEGRGRPGTFSTAGGLGQLSAALAGGLRHSPSYATRVVELSRDGTGFRVGLEQAGGSLEWRVRRIVIATPGRVASELVARLDADAAGWIDSVRYAPIATVGLSASPGSLRRPAEGFGFLVPRGEARGLLGCLFMSELFPDRAPEGRGLLHCILGGTRAPETLELADADLIALATEQLDAPLGVIGELEALGVRRWPQAVAQPAPGHRAGLADARRRLERSGPIALAGSYTDGVSVADSFASGLAAAERIARPG